MIGFLDLVDYESIELNNDIKIPWVQSLNSSSDESDNNKRVLRL